MREIKFRAWDKTNQKMLYNGIILDMSDCSRHSTMAGFTGFTPDNIDLMQFTGLRDKNGKEIYEGDIISGEDEIHWKIVFRQAAYFAYSESTFIDIDDRWTELNIFDLNYFEVIGNIYENEDLLK